SNHRMPRENGVQMKLWGVYSKTPLPKKGTYIFLSGAERGLGFHRILVTGSVTNSMNEFKTAYRSPLTLTLALVMPLLSMPVPVMPLLSMPVPVMPLPSTPVPVMPLPSTPVP